jgi:hypothetical protein
MNNSGTLGRVQRCAVDDETTLTSNESGYGRGKKNKKFEPKQP